MAALVRIDTDLKEHAILSDATRARSLWSRPPGGLIIFTPWPASQSKNMSTFSSGASRGDLQRTKRLTFSPSFSCGFRAMGQMPSKPVMGHIRPSTRGGGLISGRRCLQHHIQR